MRILPQVLFVVPGARIFWAPSTATLRATMPVDESLFWVIYAGLDKGAEQSIGAPAPRSMEEVKLSVCIPGVGELHVEVDQIEPDPWNFLVGMLWAVDERVYWMVEGGMGDRGYVITGLTVRF